MHAKLLQSCLTLATPWTAAHQAPLSTGFSRQEYWSGLPFPSPLLGKNIPKMKFIVIFIIFLFPAAAAKSLQSCLTLCDPIDGSPPGSSVHGIFQARALEWGAVAFSDPKTRNPKFLFGHIHQLFTL